MDGKLFLSSNVMPPHTTYFAATFNFDLQRFAFKVDTVQPEGALFSVVKDNSTYYGTESSEFTTDNLTGATDIKILGDITLAENVEVDLGATITNVITVDANATLDLGEHTLTIKRESGNGTISLSDSSYTNPVSAIVVNNGKSFTVTGGTNGKIDYTWDPSSSNVLDTIKFARTSAAIQVGNKVGKYTITDVPASTDKAIFNMQSGTITSNSTAISMSDNAVVNVSDGTVQSNKSCGIYYGNNSPGGGVINISGGTIQSGQDEPATGSYNSQLPAIQISGSVGQTTSATLEITGGTIKFANNGYNAENNSGYFDDKGKPVGNPDAIYAGGNTTLKITNGTITSTGTAVELRAGSLDFSGGTVESTATKAYSVNTNSSNSSGGQTFGAALAIAQHTTKSDIQVKVSEEAKATGQVALAVENPVKNTDKTSTISADITGGTFESKGTGATAIAAKAADSRSTININGKVTFIGTVENTVADASATTPSITFGKDAAVTVVNVLERDPETGEITKSEESTYDSTALQFTETWTETVDGGGTVDRTETYPVNNKAWNKSAHVPNKFFYLVANNDESKIAGDKAVLAPKTTNDAETTLALTTGLPEAQKYEDVIAVDFNNTVFSSLFGESSKFTALDASAITQAKEVDTYSDRLKLNIIGNDKITSILGSAGSDSLTAGSAGASLNGGAGDDSLVGGNGNDTFIYSAGKDIITNYTYGTDIVSVTSNLTPPLSFDSINYSNSAFVFNFDADNNLTFNGKSEIELRKGDAVYSYKGKNANIEYIAFDSGEEHGISLGAAHDSLFNGTVEANENYATIDASKVNIAIKVTGNDKDNYIIAGASGGTLDGGYGDDSLKGGDGADTFVYSAGTDSIQDYGTGDLVTLRGFRPTDATFIAAGTSNISLDFGGSDKLVFEGVNNDLPISLQSGQNIYTYTKDYQALNGKSVTLAASFVGSFAAGDYYTVDASAVTNAVSIAGNANNNLIIGSASATNGTLYGGAGNDKLNVSERNNDAKFTFQYTAGKDIVLGFDANNDNLDITPEQIDKITAATASNGKLAFTFGNKSDVLTFKSEGDINAVSLQSGTGNYLTKDGYVEGDAFSLFGSAKGKIDLTEDPYQDAGITSVDATEVKKQSVTLTGGPQGGTFTFAENRKKDLFEYGGGSVTISGYEAGKDKINLGDFSIDGFQIAGGGVSLNVGGNTMSIAGAAQSEILIRQATGKSNSYSKMVFYDNGVLLNKGKRPTIATVSGGASGYQAENTIKKIYVTGGVSGIAVHAGNNKTTLDSSDAGGVSLYGGAKNDKLIGNESDKDYFFYSAGKDVIENYATDEEISLTGSGLDLDDAKITVSKKSLKFKFSGSKNALTIKSNDTINSAIVDGETYTFSKNAIGKDKNVSLTSQFSGTYKISKDDAGKIEVVYGDAVKKNLTFKGSEEAETFTGGTKKTTFKGGGGADSLVGGSGKDIFFYAKGDKGSATIASFDFTKDKIKIANGTIGEISTVSGGIQFDMTSGKKGDTSNVGSFTLASSISGGGTGTAKAIDTSKVFIKANNNYYWFAQEADSDYNVNVGDLITADRKVSKSNATATGFAIIDLGYSTNLTKSGVATKAGDFAFSSDGISKKTTET